MELCCFGIFSKSIKVNVENFTVLGYGQLGNEVLEFEVYGVKSQKRFKFYRPQSWAIGLEVSGTKKFWVYVISCLWGWDDKSILGLNINAIPNLLVTVPIDGNLGLWVYEARKFWLYAVLKLRNWRVTSISISKVRNE